MAMVALDNRLGILSGIITLQIICIGDAPILWAASIIFGLISLRLLSTRRAIKGKAAITSGTMDAVVPTDVPTIARVRGITIIIRIRNGIERRRFITTFNIRITHFGSGRTPPFSPTTSSTPMGKPIIIANSVAKTVTYTVSHIARGNSFLSIHRASSTASDAKILSNIISDLLYHHISDLI
jgi:hypothetical protein